MMFKVLLTGVDRSAIALSTLCVIHCLVVPIVLIALPTITGLAVFSDERFHTWLLFAVMPISLFAVAVSFFQYQNPAVVILALAGIFILLLVAVLGETMFGSNGEVILTVIGSALVALAHLKNMRHRRALHSGNNSPDYDG